MHSTPPVDFMKDLFKYNRECNMAITQRMQEHETILSEKSIHIQSHILNSHYIWNCKIKNAAPNLSPWAVRKLSDMDYADSRNFSDSLDILSRYSLHQPVNYSISGTGPFTRTVLELLFQVINHATYHRGQLALCFREVGIEPLLTEYIVYKIGA